jgi:predicted short-subunit dehydrogenase-like oxidoreductase (DUF2520 family)
MDIAIVGAGTVGTALAVSWARAGHHIVAAAGRAATVDRAAAWLPGVPVRSLAEIAGAAELIVFAVPDDALVTTVGAVAPSAAADAWLAHVSGARGLSIFSGTRARALALHPLQTFPDVAAALETLPGCAVAVTAAEEAGYRLGEQLALDLLAVPFRLADEMRPLYHAAAVFASNYLVAIAGAGERLFAAAGVPDAAAAMAPLQRATLANVERLGPRDALTGPAVRGDAGTIEANLAAIAAAAPSLVPAYVALCRVAVDVAGERLSAEGRARVEGALARWT